MAPADFAEVRRMVASMRPSLYLEGPEGFEWIFRNHLLAAREEGLYVDYVHDSGGERWVTPAGREAIAFGAPSPVIRELIVSLARLGAFDPQASQSSRRPGRGWRSSTPPIGRRWSPATASSSASSQMRVWPGPRAGRTPGGLSTASAFRSGASVSRNWTSL